MMQWLARFFAPSLERGQTLDHARLSTEGPIGLGLAALLAVMLLVGVIWLYRREEQITLKRRLALAALRGFLLLLILVLLAQPTLMLGIKQTIKQPLWVLVDDSQSMSLPGSSAGQSRSQQVTAALTAGRETWVKQIDDDYGIRVARIEASGAVTPIAWPKGEANLQQQLTAKGNRTALGSGLQNTSGEAGAILMIADFQSNSGPDAATVAARQFARGAQVFTTPVGSPNPTDLAVTTVESPPLAFVDDAVVINVSVQSSGLDGQAANVKLVENGNVLATETLTLQSGLQRLNLKWTPTSPATQQLQVVVDPLPNELTTINNQQPLLVRVSDRKMRVLIIERLPRWEFKYLLAALQRDRRIETKVVLFESDAELAQLPDSPYLARLPSTAAELGDYDVVVLGDVTPQSIAPVAELLKSYVAQLGGSLVMLAGREQMPQGLAASPLEPLVPLKLRGAQPSSGDPLGRRHSFDPPRGMKPWLSLADTKEESDKAWAELPPIIWWATLGEPQPGAQVLVSVGEGENASPLIAQQAYGVGEVMLITTDNLWRWRRNVGDKIYARLWGQLVLRLSESKLLGSAKRVRLTSDQREYVAGSAALVTARLLDEDLQPMIRPTLPATLRDSNGGTQSIELRPRIDQPGTYQTSVPLPNAGEYAIEMTELGQTVSSSLLVRSPWRELAETASNIEAAQAIATAGHGEMIAIDALKDLPQKLAQQAATTTTTLQYPLWSTATALAAVLLTAFVEWTLRRLWQLK